MGGRDARAFYSLWNLDYKRPSGIFVCWRFGLFQKRYIPMCVCAADICGYCIEGAAIITKNRPIPCFNTGKGRFSETGRNTGASAVFLQSLQTQLHLFGPVKQNRHGKIVWLVVRLSVFWLC